MARQILSYLYDNKQVLNRADVGSGSSDSRRDFHRRLDRWRAQGLTGRAANVLAIVGCETVEQVREAGPKAFATFNNVGAKTMEEIRRLVGGWNDEPRTPQAAIAKALRLALPSDEEALEAATDAVIALTKSGFVVVARSQPAGSR